MESQPNPAPLIVIIGPTASGKSALAMQIAQQFDGEIIAADSRTMYVGMDISTAKPTPEDQRLVPHHLLDVATPDHPATVAEFKNLADQAIDDIAVRGKLPLLVGGSGLYVDAVVYGFSFLPPAQPALRQALKQLSVPQLQERLREQGIAPPANASNPRHLVRALETSGAKAGRGELRPRTLLLGVDVERGEHAERVRQRIEEMFASGLLEEAKRMAVQYGWEAPPLQTPAYKALRNYLEGHITLDRAKELFLYNDLHLAKRQRTWFKRNKDIVWISKPDEAIDLITTFLNN